MKQISIIIFAVLIITLAAQIGLPPRYHTYDEMKAELDSLQAVYPDLVYIDSIGVTQNDNLPIWAVKLSDNASQNEDEPAVLYVGQCHAEEVLGIEICMWMINDILENRFYEPYNIWLSEMEIWFVPTYNPEGLQVVMDGWDTSYRKNKRDNNENGIFDYVEGPGNDIDGVDLNRNYGFNWVHGDTLYCPGGEETYDYYRGPAAFSEGGTQAIRSLAQEQHFIFSINWHSSRTGNLSEKVFYSFEWDGVKQSPDFEVNKLVGESVAALIETESGTETYEPSPARGRNGNAQDWFYKQHGTTQLLIECGTQNLQPPAWLVDDTCQRCSNGAYWLLNRVMGYETEASLLTGHVSNSQTGEAVSAEIVVQQHYADWFAPRLSEAEHGRFWRVLQPGTYTVQVQKEGFQTQIYDNVVVNSSGWTTLEVQLQPLEPASLSGQITSEGQPVSARIVLAGVVQDTIWAEGSYNFEAYEGAIELTAFAAGYVPKHTTVTLVTGENELNLEFCEETRIFNENWQNGLQAWNIDDEWCLTETDENGLVLKNHDNNRFYSPQQNNNIETLEPINLQDANEDVALIWQQKYYTEWDNDIGSVLVSTNSSEWQQVAAFSGVKDYWHYQYVSLADYVDQQIYLKFNFSSDATLNDPGWFIDNIKIISSSGIAANEGETVPAPAKLYKNYPNPFNPSTKIEYALPAHSQNASIQIFNLKGRLIKKIKLQPQTNFVVWNGLDKKNRKVSSGIYFYTLTIDDKQLATQKMLLLK
jgi:hypothetical protein